MVQPTPLPLNDANMLRIVRERHITRTQVMACLCHGAIDESAHENIRGNWKCTLRHHHAGDLVRVTAAIEKDENGDWIAVVTVF